MRPNDTQDQNVPSAPPPDQLPRPRMQRMSDIRPPVKHQPLQKVQPANANPSVPQLPIVESKPTVSVEKAAAAPVSTTPPSPPKKSSKLKIILLAIIGFVMLAAAAAAGAFLWYQQQLGPVDQGGSQRIRVVIGAGSTPNMIAKELKEKSLIRNETAFLIYTQLAKVRDDLKAGTYNLKQSESLPEIVNHLVSGKQDEFSLTFLPGDTLANHRKRIINAGYSAEEVDAALAKKYDRPLLFAGKPATADLEGYIYGETYNFLSSASVEDILNRTFDEFEKVVKSDNLVAGFQKQGLSLYQGITLASIIQREVPTAGDQKQVAGVFYNRIKAGMTLGSDVTYQYIADKTGVPRDPSLDSPYNTRRYKGLTPGPIASPGQSALRAAAAPATNDYLFFLSGDDDKTYFGRTDAEHQRNIVEHCQKKCQIL